MAAFGVLALAAPAPAPAQQPSAQLSIPITLTVRPALAIRSVIPVTARVDANGQVTSTMVVQIESNLPYRLTVRLAPGASPTAVLVRSADGTFEPLDPGGSITTALSRSGGLRGHEVVCRVEAPASQCPLAYELAAEHGDLVFRSVAALPQAGGKRTEE